MSFKIFSDFLNERSSIDLTNDLKFQLNTSKFDSFSQQRSNIFDNIKIPQDDSFRQPNATTTATATNASFNETNDKVDFTQILDHYYKVGKNNNYKR
jgi:hypothetical protein